MRRGQEEESELKLELSIGGIYGKSENQKQVEQKIIRENPVEQSNLVDKIGFKFVDLQKRKEIHQDMNNGEEGRKRLRWMSNVTEDRMFLEGQGFQDRRIKERDWFCEDSAKKSIFSVIDKDLDLCLYKGGKTSGIIEHCGNSSKDFDLGVGKAKSFSSGSIECSSSAASSRRSTSPKGDGSNYDTGSHSSSLSSLQNQSARTKPDSFKHHEGIGSSSPTEPDQKLTTDGHLYTTVVTSSLPRQSNRSTTNIKSKTHSGQTNNTRSKSEKPAPNNSLVERPQQPLKAASKVASDVSCMPCVSTTGNGPNGKTINGFLYRCSKLEISIMCVCHGKFFSPAEFVEHAGGIDIEHPMRRITMVR